jgi:hypothetical protein
MKVSCLQEVRLGHVARTSIRAGQVWLTELLTFNIVTSKSAAREHAKHRSEAGTGKYAGKSCIGGDTKTYPMLDHDVLGCSAWIVSPGWMADVDHGGYALQRMGTCVILLFE